MNAPALDLDPKKRTQTRRKKALGAGDEDGADEPKLKKSRARPASKAKDGAQPEQDGAAQPEAPVAAAPAACVAVASAEPKAPKARRASKAAAPTLEHYHLGLRPPAYDGDCYRFLSWNVAGMRALMKKDAGALKRLVEAEKLDAVCLQETKLSQQHLEAVMAEAGLVGWSATWNCSAAKKGYAGTATLCRRPPLAVSSGIGAAAHDDEARVVTVELPDLYLVNTYVPNSGEGLKRLEYRTREWDAAFAAYIARLQASKPVVLAGDLNCAHQEIDIHDPKRNLRSAGFTVEERESFSAQLLGDCGLVDSYRALHPQVVGFTYYSYRFNARAKQKGWRLDYFLVSAALQDKVHDSFILPDVTGSDHVPIGLVLKK